VLLLDVVLNYLHPSQILAYPVPKNQCHCC